MAAEPNPLGKLMLEVMDRDGYTSVAELARHTTAVSYQTLYAWVSGKVERNRKRPPAVPVLRQLATDLRIEEAPLFAAAGRSHEESSILNRQDLEFVSILRGVPDEQRQNVIIAASLLGRLSTQDMDIVMQLARDLERRERTG